MRNINNGIFFLCRAGFSLHFHARALSSLPPLNFHHSEKKNSTIICIFSISIKHREKVEKKSFALCYAFAVFALFVILLLLRLQLQFCFGIVVCLFVCLFWLLAGTRFWPKRWIYPLPLAICHIHSMAKPNKMNNPNEPNPLQFPKDQKICTFVLCQRRNFIWFIWFICQSVQCELCELWITKSQLTSANE